MNISIGQYYPTDSIIHKIDARVKIIATLLFLTFVLVSKTFIGNFISLGFLVIVIALSKVPFKLILRSFRGVMFLLILTGIINVLFNKEGHVLFEISFIKITTGGLLYATRMIFRLIILIIGSSMLTFTTQTLDFADGLEYLLNPLKRVKFPAHEISMMLTIALRFIPTIMEEMDKIKKAQMSRGVDFESGNLIKKIKSFIPILIPLFVSSFKRADELATAMEARCYRGDVGRTKLKVLHLNRLDYYAMFFLAVYCLIIVVVRFTIER